MAGAATKTSEESISVSPAITVVRETTIVHDTTIVRDTVVRVALPERGPDLIGPTLGLATAVAVAILSQSLRSFVEDNRSRERLRQALLQEVAILQIYLTQLVPLAVAWQLPPSSNFWVRFDHAMAGYDELHVDGLLLADEAWVLVGPFFLKVKELRFGAEKVAQDYAAEHESVSANKGLNSSYDRRFAHVEGEAKRLATLAAQLYEQLFDAWPRWPKSIGANARKQSRTIAEAQSHARKRGLLNDGDVQQ